MVDFLDLPYELRAIVYKHVLPAQYLRVQQKFPDESYVNAAHKKLGGIPAIFFANKAIYAEASAIFYSKAVLDLAPIGQPTPSRMALIEAQTPAATPLPATPFASPFAIPIATPAAAPSRPALHQRATLALSTAPTHHLQQLMKARLFKGSRRPASSHEFETSLTWLICNTTIQDIYCSPKATPYMPLAREEDLVPAESLCSAHPGLEIVRLVRIYQGVGAQLPNLRRGQSGLMSESRDYNQDPTVLAGIYEPAGRHGVIWNPRAHIERASTPEYAERLTKVADWIDALWDEEEEKKRVEPGSGLKLYRLCFVLRRTRPSLRTVTKAFSSFRIRE
jgi:hypothetical protein